MAGKYANNMSNDAAKPLIARGPQVAMKSLDVSKKVAPKAPKKGPSFLAPKKP
jgi:hypothetical protein